MNGFLEGRAVCNFCGEEISVDAKRCPYCGSILKTEQSLDADETKTGNYNDGSKDRYYSEELFDNSINTGEDVSDFIHEERYNERGKGLHDNKPNEQLDENRGLFDSKPNEQLDENRELFDSKPNEQLDENRGLFDSKPNEQLDENRGLFDSKPNEQLDENRGLFDSKPNEQLDENRGSFDSNHNEQLRENRGSFGVNPNDKVEEGIHIQENSNNFNQMPREPRPINKPEMGNVTRQQRPPMKNAQAAGVSGKPSLTNAMKVFITTICNFVPGIGQLIGVIIAIVFMNNEDDTDKRSFGVALLVSSIVVFVLWSISCCVLAIALSDM
ncbi:MAG: hypothetical protein GX270_06270 [Clostridiaceae bacterium]|jgi:uncharacterized membrane protein|nr:hypothetical protein [Clostridiaceae bacterium]